MVQAGENAKCLNVRDRINVRGPVLKVAQRRSPRNTVAWRDTEGTITSNSDADE